jgi:hypothetical protein
MKKETEKILEEMEKLPFWTELENLAQAVMSNQKEIETSEPVKNDNPCRMCVYSKDLICEDLDNCPGNGDAMCYIRKEIVLNLTESANSTEEALRHIHHFRGNKKITEIVTRLLEDVKQLSSAIS